MKLSILLQLVGLATASVLTTMAPKQTQVVTTTADAPITEAALNEEQIRAMMDDVRIVYANQHDKWQCATENMTQYFEVPTPTGALFSALVTYGNSQTSKYCTYPEYDWDLCDAIPTSAWCGFATAAPTSVLDAYSTHASMAYSFVSAHSSGLEAMPTDCPITWEEAGMEVPNGEGWLNQTLAHAACYKLQHEPK